VFTLVRISIDVVKVILRSLGLKSVTVTATPRPGWASRRIAERAKIRPISFHGLRRTHATDLSRAGVHPKIASERLGHASIATTMDTCGHAIPGLREDAAQRIDAALRSALPKN
jgi:integrase